MSLPLVTVVMPVFNAEKYLRESIDSILNQTYGDFIFLIINDGSQDESEKIILSYSDKRIRSIRNEENIGLTNTLNKAIHLTETEFFARMDADDIANPERLEVQLTFMRENPEIGLCGSLCERIGAKTGTETSPLTDEEIKAGLLFGNNIVHSSVIIRTNLLKVNNIFYGVDFDYADGYGHKLLELEDYALWHKLKHVTKFSVLNKVLLKYRAHKQNLSNQNKEAVKKRKIKFTLQLLNELEFTATHRELQLHWMNSDLEFKKSISLNDLEIVKKYYDSILIANAEKKIYPQKELSDYIVKEWQQLFYFLCDYKNLGYIMRYWRVSGKIQEGQFIYAVKFYLKNIFKRED